MLSDLLKNGGIGGICTEKSNYVPHRRGGGHIVFGADPVGVGVSAGVSMTLYCLHNIS